MYEYLKAVCAQSRRLGVHPDALAAELYHPSVESLAEALKAGAGSLDEGDYLAPVYEIGHGREMDNFGRVCYRPAPVRFGKVATAEGGTRHVFTIPQTTAHA